MRLLIAIFTLVLFSCGALAQSNVQIIDLATYPSKLVNQDIEFCIKFKVSDISQVDEIHVAMKSDSVTTLLNTVANVSNNAGNYEISSNGKTEVFHHYEATVHLHLTHVQYEELALIEVYVTDSQGENSAKLSTEF